ncbi:MAG: DUF4142 domain-containing protein, partial [Chitinophagaceae bacterium]
TCIVASIVFAGISCNDGRETSGGNDRTTIRDSMDSNNTDTTTAANTGAQNGDSKLVSELIESMYGGIALMQQGQEKAITPAVKSLAKKLETAHTALTNDLKDLVAKKGWTLPSGESADDIKTRTDMADDEAAEYEKEWLKALEDRHETNIKKLENANTQDADLQALSAKGLPKLKELLSSIEAVQKGLK